MSRKAWTGGVPGYVLVTAERERTVRWSTPTVVAGVEPGEARLTA
jgi:hypothetical protein